MAVVAKRQTAGWIKMPLGTKVCLGPGDIVLDGNPAPSKKGRSTPTFRPVSIMAKRSRMSATAELLLKVISATGSDVVLNRPNAIFGDLA